MDIYNLILDTYPSIDPSEFVNGKVELRDDGDGKIYIYKWEFDFPLPNGLNIGK